MDVFAYEQNAISTHHVIHSIDSYLLTFDNILQDKVLDTNEQYTNLTSYIQYATLTHLMSYIAPDKSYADDPSEPSLPMSDDTLQDDESDGDSDNQPLKLVSGLIFASWDGFKNWLNRFALKEGFDHKIRTSEKNKEF
ncbi:unnamed protein product [Rhizophagus irregularis]|nr:unnamed protein product [Rhizophagus irregularis]